MIIFEETGHEKWPKMGQNSIIGSVFAQRAKNTLIEGQRPPKELEVGPRSRPYLLVKNLNPSHLMASTILLKKKKKQQKKVWD